MIAIALIFAFGLGSVCTVALLFCLKSVAERVGIREKVQKQQEQGQEETAESEDGKPPIDEQYKNFFSFDGTKQTGKDVKQSDDKD